MSCIVIAESPRLYIPIVQTNDPKLAEKVLDWFRKNRSQNGAIFSIVSGADDYGVVPAELFPWD